MQVQVQDGNSLEHTPVHSFTPLSYLSHCSIFHSAFSTVLLLFFYSFFYFLHFSFLLSTFYFLLAIFSTSFSGLRGSCMLSRKQAV